jgi:D-alanine-D-alanine ligase-like ATP-grasp enzyme
MGGPSEECEVSKATGAAVSAACRSIGYDVLKLSFQDNYAALLPKLKNADIVFNALHGGMGENGEIQAWLEENLIVYTGSGPEASELCMDKSRSKAVARNLGVKTADWELLHHVYETHSIGLPCCEIYPCIARMPPVRTLCIQLDFPPTRPGFHRFLPYRHGEH